jgi:hypothetical protein
VLRRLVHAPARRRRRSKSPSKSPSSSHVRSNDRNRSPTARRRSKRRRAHGALLRVLVSGRAAGSRVNRAPRGEQPVRLPFAGRGGRSVHRAR